LPFGNRATRHVGQELPETHEFASVRSHDNPHEATGCHLKPRWATQVQVSQLTADNFDAFTTETPVAVVLYLHSTDPQSAVLRQQLATVAGGFRTGIGFGCVDLAQASNDQLAADCFVAITPLLSFYQCGEVIDADVVGFQHVVRDLNREYLLHWFGRARTGATLIE